MRTLLVASALASTALSVGAASAASPSVPPALRDGGACFERARVFDRTLQAAFPSLDAAAETPSPRLRQATETRNQGITACFEGRVQEGADMIEQATSMLPT
jgi:hypothetical protein